MKPQTAAACAVHYAHEESKRLFAKANSGGEVPALSLDALALQVRQPAEKQTHWLSWWQAKRPDHGYRGAKLFFWPYPRTVTIWPSHQARQKGVRDAQWRQAGAGNARDHSFPSAWGDCRSIWDPS